MNTYANAGNGLRKMFISMVGTIICALLAVIPYIGAVASIGILVFSVVSMVGLYHIGKDIKACRVAFILRTISVIVSVAANFVSVLGLLELVTGLFPFVSEILLLVSVTKVLREKGATDVANLGKRTLVLTIVFTVATSLFGIVFFGAALSDFSGMLLFMFLGCVVVLVLAIVSIVFYFKFLLNSAEAFGAYV